MKIELILFVTGIIFIIIGTILILISKKKIIQKKWEEFILNKIDGTG